MKPRSTLILLALLFLLGSYVWFYDRNQKGTAELAENAGHFLQIDRDKVKSVSIQNAESKIELRKHDNNQWFLEDGVKDRADSGVIAQLFTSVETLRSESTVSVSKDKGKLKEFGITDANTRVKFAGGPKDVELIFGKDTAVEGKIYAYVEGGDDVYVIGNDLRNQITKKPEDFRDRKLTDLTPQQVTKVQIKSAQGELELAKKNSHWSIAKPLEARGDDSKINDVVAQATSAHVDQFLPEGKLADYGLSEPRGTLTFQIEGSDKPVVLQIGSNPKEAKDKEKTWVKLSGRDGVMLVPKTIESALSSKPNDLRDHALVRVESDIVDRMTVEPAEGEKLVLARNGEKWVRKEGKQDVPMNSAMATRLLSDLQNAQVIDFVSDVANDLPKYGLDHPQAKVTFSSYAKENTAESNAGEQPIVSVLFGKAENDKIYAKLDGEPFIVDVAATVFDAVPKSAIELHDLVVYSYKPEEITQLEVTYPNQDPVSLEREKEGTWKLSKGEGKINTTNVTALVNALVSLQAVRWEGLVKPEQGFDKPAVVVSFTVTQGEKKTPGKLSIANITPEELYHAMAESEPGVFLMGKPDHDAFLGALTDRPAPPPPAAPAPPPAPTTAPAPPTPTEPAPAAATPPVPPTPAPMPAPPVPAPTTPPPAPPTPAEPAPAAPTPPVPPAPAPMPAPPTPAPAPPETVPPTPAGNPPPPPAPAPAEKAPSPAPPEAATPAPAPTPAPPEAPAPAPAPPAVPTAPATPEAAAPAPAPPAVPAAPAAEPPASPAPPVPPAQ